METPALEQLMGAYLHQDYRLVGDLGDNLDAFVLESPDLAPLLPAEIDWTIRRFESDSELKEYLFALGCELRPLPDEGGYREWLRGIAHRVQARLAEQN